MPLRRPAFPAERDPHVPTRTMGAMAAVLALLIALVTLWPARAKAPVERFDTERELIQPIELVEIAPTAQPPPPAITAPPPPPTVLDLPPVEVDDLEEVQREIVADFDIDIPAPDAAVPGPVAPPGPPAPPAPLAPPGPPAPSRPAGPPPPPTFVERPDVVPRPRFAPFPTYPDAARRARVQARAIIEATVTEAGRAEGLEIVERVVIDRRGNETPVATLPHGMEAEALATAQRYTFTPAKHQGRTVRTRTRIRLLFGAE